MLRAWAAAHPYLVIGGVYLLASVLVYAWPVATMDRTHEEPP